MAPEARVAFRGAMPRHFHIHAFHAAWICNLLQWIRNSH